VRKPISSICTVSFLCSIPKSDRLALLLPASALLPRLPTPRPTQPQAAGQSLFPPFYPRLSPHPLSTGRAPCSSELARPPTPKAVPTTKLSLLSPARLRHGSAGGCPGSASSGRMSASRRVSRNITTEELVVLLFAAGADQPAAPRRRRNLHRGRLRRAAAALVGRPQWLVLVATATLPPQSCPDPQA
jgi:hypothetical protein